MKMYVIVRTDIPVAQQAVQGGHALAEHILGFPHSGWNNGTLVYLGVPHEYRLNRIADKLQFLGIDAVIWREPDMDNEATAIAACGCGDLLKNINCI